MNTIARMHISIVAATLVAVLSAGTALASGDHEGGHDDAEDQAEAGGHGHEEDGHGDGGHGHDDGGHSFGFGRPADPADADRTVEVIARDTMTFEPDSVQVKPGETVRFVVRNVGQLQHSFTLATPAAQRQHEQEMQGMPADEMAGHMRDDPNGIVVQPGATGSLVWRFAGGGPVQFACHIPGHYPAGMKGRIRIE